MSEICCFVCLLIYRVVKLKVHSQPQPKRTYQEQAAQNDEGAIHTRHFKGQLDRAQQNKT